MRLTGAAIFWWIKRDVCCAHSEVCYCHFIFLLHYILGADIVATLFSATFTGRYFLVTEQIEIKWSPLNKLIELFYCTFTRNEEHLNASLVIIQ